MRTRSKKLTPCVHGYVDTPPAKLSRMAKIDLDGGSISALVGQGKHTRGWL
jgi:hypothetical protein